jgi:hypothetical protein
MMLAGCGIENRFPGFGLIDVYSSQRISVGKLINFTRASPMPK